MSEGSGGKAGGAADAIERGSDPALLQRARLDAFAALADELAEVPTLLPDALERRDAVALSRLRELHARSRDSLTLLGRVGTATIADEALAVLNALAADSLAERPGGSPEDVPSALLGAHDALMDALVAARQGGAAGALATAGAEPSDTAIVALDGGHVGDAMADIVPALAVLNELRSLRGEAFLSAPLLLALDVSVEPIRRHESEAFAAAAKRARPRVMRLLIDWFRGVNAGQEDAVGNGQVNGPIRRATAALATEFAALGQQASAAGLGRSECDLPLAAARAALAISDGRLEGGGAVRRLFALLERWLVSRSRTDEADGDGAHEHTGLLRDLLFYAATAGEPSDRDDDGLDGRYGFDRIRAAAHAATHRSAGPRPPTQRLRRELIARSREELAPIVDWLSLGGDAPQERVIRARIGRLADLEPMFVLLGADDCRKRLARLREAFSVPGETTLDEPRRLVIATELVHLDRALDRLSSAAPDAAPTSPAAAAAAQDDDDPARALAARVARIGGDRGDNRAGGDDALLAAEAALLAEARRRLVEVEGVLAERLAVSVDGSASAQRHRRDAASGPGVAVPDGGALVARIRRIARALEIVPRPEVTALLDRLADVVGWLPARPHAALGEATARLVVAIDGCLGVDALGTGGKLPSAGAQEAALDAAERALTAVERELPARRALGLRIDAPTEERGQRLGDARRATEAALDAFTAIGRALDGAPADGESLGQGFATLRRLAREHRQSSLERLSLAAGRRLPLDGLEATERERTLAQLREAHASLPQLIERISLASGDLAFAERVDDTDIDGLEALIASLEEADPEAQGTTDPLDNTLRAVFVEECAEHLAVLDRAFARAGPETRSGEPAPSEARVLRALHTLIGSAQTASADDIVRLVRPMQSAVLALQDRNTDPEPDERDLFARTCAALHRRLDAFDRGRSSMPQTPTDGSGDEAVDEAGDERLIAELRALAERGPIATSPLGPSLATSPSASLASSSADAARTGPIGEIFDEEAHELMERLAALADAGVPAERRRLRALSVLHTLKGTARVVGRVRVADRAHLAEADIAEDPAMHEPAALMRLRRELLALLDGRGAGADVARAPPDELAVEPPDDPAVDPADGPYEPGNVEPAGSAPSTAAVPLPAMAHASAGSTASESPTPAAPSVPLHVPTAAAPERAEGDGDTRVREADWQRLVTLAADVSASQSRLGAELERLREASAELDVAAQRWRRLPAAESWLETEAARELMSDLRTVRATLAEALRAVELEQRRGARSGIALQQDLVRARLVRFDKLEMRLRRTLDDALDAFGRSGELRLEGGATMLDAALQTRLAPALEHLVRNAVVHGLEDEASRRATGKPARGRVTVRATIDGLDLVVRVVDDGRGIAEELRAAHRPPHAPDDASMDTEGLLESLAASGFSTLATSGELGGHGLGLGAARERIAELGGRLALLQPSAGGTSFEIRLPQRLPVQQVVLVYAGELIAVPVNFIASIESPDGADALDAAARSVPELSSLLGNTSLAAAGAARDARRRLRFVSSAGAVMVEAVLGYRELLVQPLDRQLAALGRYTGTSALPDGRRVFVIDPRALHRMAGDAARAHGGRAAAPAHRSTDASPNPSVPRALVVDDSPTQRAWAEDALRQLGFTVEIARDGREALDRLAQDDAETPDVMLLDVDMPRIDGYGVLEALQRQGEMPFPVLVMTTRSSQRDRHAALNFGATDFLAKPGSLGTLRDALVRAGVLAVD